MIVDWKSMVLASIFTFLPPLISGRFSISAFSSSGVSFFFFLFDLWSQGRLAPGPGRVLFGARLRFLPAFSRDVVPLCASVYFLGTVFIAQKLAINQTKIEDTGFLLLVLTIVSSRCSLESSAPSVGRFWPCRLPNVVAGPIGE